MNEETTFLIHWFELVNQKTLFSSVISNQEPVDSLFLCQSLFSARLANKKIRLVERKPQADWKLTAKQLDNELSANPVPPKSMLILTNPDNPTGCTYSEDELKALR